MGTDRFFRKAAGVLLLAWGAWWCFFAVASASDPRFTLEAVPPLLLAALLVVGIPLVAWRWRRYGGALLVAEGAVLLGLVVGVLRNPPGTTAFLIGTLALPPVVAGLLLAAPVGEKRELG